MNIFKFLVLFSIIELAFSDSTICPSNQTINSGTGTLPTGATQLTLIPVNQDCLFQFNMPTGKVLKLVIYSFQSVSDNILGESSDEVHNIPASDTGYEIRSAATSLTLLVSSKSGELKFYAEYFYIDVSNYSQKRFATGSFFNLEFKPSTYYTFEAKQGDNVTITIGRQNTESNDPVIQNVFVHDGPNLTSPCLGRLSYLSSIKGIISSTSTYLTLVNYYGTQSNNTWIVGNDASILSIYDKYYVYVSHSNQRKYGKLNALSQFNGYTFICADCDTFYLEKLDFDSLGTILNLAYVSFSGMTPTHRLSPPLTYTAMLVSDYMFPQKIASNVFTMSLKMGSIALNLTTDPEKWRKAYKKREGYLINPTSWNPAASSSSMNEKFEDDSEALKFSVNFNQTSFLNGESLQVNIGSNNKPTFSETYPGGKSDGGKIESIGNYLELNFKGNSASKAKIGYRMTEVSSANAFGFLFYLPVIIFFFLTH